MGFFNKKSDRWERKPDDIAVRIESSDVKSQWGNKPFVVSDGTKALIFAQGKKLGHLDSGQHDIDGRFRKWLAGDDPTTLIIVDDGNITLDVDITGLYDRDNIAVDIKVRLTLDLTSPETFYLNVMKDRRHYLRGDLYTHVRPELHDALLAFTSVRPIDDLYHNPAIRQQAEDQIRGRFGDSLGRLGFRLVSLELARVNSQQFDAQREKIAEISLESRSTEIEAARQEVLQLARENLVKHKKHAVVTGAEFSDALSQATHELGLKERLREDEMSRLNAQLEADAADYDQQRTQDREADRVEHGLEIDATEKDHARQQMMLDADTFLQLRIKESATKQEERDLEREGDEKDLDFANKARNAALDARKRMKMDDTEILAEKAATVSKMDASTKIALGLGDSDALLELERLEREGQMTPDQLLIMAAGKSDAVAAALAERFKSEGKLSDEVVDQLRRQMEAERQTNHEHSAQLERVMNQALQQMGKVATAQAESSGPGDQTIVTGGAGTPYVINPKQNHTDEDKKE